MSKQFSALKKQSKTQFDDLVKKLETAAGNTNKDFNDDRFWEPTKDKSGKAFAIIRFLPAGPTDEIPFAKCYSHGFQGPKGQWYIEECPTTIGKECPTCQSNNELWESGEKEKKLIVSGSNGKPGRKRKLKYVFNIFVVSDPANKEAEGKRWLYKAGKKVMDKITAKAKPDFDGVEPINVFDFWEGANFKLAIKQVEGYPNYDACEFSEPSKLFDGDDAKLEALWKEIHSLAEFTDPAKFKSYDDLKTKFNKIVGAGVNIPSTAESVQDSVVGKTASAASLPTAAEEPEDDTLAMFRAMAEGGDE